MCACSFPAQLSGIHRIPLTLLVITVILFCCMTTALPLRAASAPVHIDVSVGLGAGRGGVGSDGSGRGGYRRTVALRSVCSQQLLQILPRRKERVNALGPGSLHNQPNKHAMLLITSTGEAPGSVTLVFNLTKEYLCFSGAGKLVMRAKKRSNCVFSEQHEISADGGESLFRYSVRMPSVRSPSRPPKTFYLAFRNNGKRLRGDKWQDGKKFESCTYFHKEQDHIGDLNLPTQDPHAPNVDLDHHLKHNVGVSTSDSSSEHAQSRQVQDNEAPNHNEPYAPWSQINQKHSKITLVNTDDGHHIRHGARKAGHGT